MSSLDALLNSEFAMLALTVGTPDALASIFRSRPEIEAIRQALSEGALGIEEIREFVSTLVQQFQPNQKFSYDYVLGALAVALENIPGKFADGFLNDLSSLSVREIPLSPRIARIAISERNRQLIQTTSKFFTLPIPAQMQRGLAIEPIREYRPFRVPTGGSEEPNMFAH